MNKELGQDDQNGNARRNVALGTIIGLMAGGAVDLISGDYGWGAVVGMLLGAALGWRLERVHFMEYPPRIVRRLVVSGFLFFGILLAGMVLLGRENSDSLRLALAMAPLLPGLWFVATVGSAIANLDELQRRIQVEAIAIGFGLTVLITMTIGLLGSAGVPEPSWLLVTFIMIFSWLLGKIWTRWHYR